MKKVLLISCIFSTLFFVGCSSNQTKVLSSNGNGSNNIAMNKSHTTKNTSNVHTIKVNDGVVYPEEVKVNAQGQPEPVFIN